MSTPHPHRAWREPPIVFQILVLLFGGLVVAQLVTLILTMVVPPAPPTQHSMSDIVSALRGEDKAARLTRALQDGPPDVGGAGWFTSDESRDALAHLLNHPASDVRLAFYAPLPFAGMTVPPTQSGQFIHPAAQDDGASVRNIAWTVDPAPLLPNSTRGSMLRYVADQPGGGFPAGGAMPGGVFLGGGNFPGGTNLPGGSGAGLPRQDPSRDIARPGERGGLIGDAPGGAGAIDRDLARPGAAASPGDLYRQPMGPFRSEPGPAGMPDSVRDPSGMPADRAAGFPTPAIHEPGTAMPGLAAPGIIGRDIVQHAPASQPAASPVVTDTGARRVREQSATAPAPREPAKSVPSIPMGTESVAPPVATPAHPSAEAPRQEMADATPLPIRPQGKALFGLAPAPFVEGDFVAAMRVPDGRWIVVQPAADGFPNAWQRRVLLWFAVAFALVAPIGWLYARHIVRPLARFTAAAEQLGRDPSAALVALEGPAEIGRAAHAFNVMQSRLRSFVDDRTAMVGAISHDLRTPLTRLRFRIEEVEADAIRDGMNDEVAEMEAMITSVLTFIRDASTPNARERLDLGMLVEDVAQDAKMIGSDVEVESLASAPVEIDVLGMRRLLSNLVENAVKYGDRARIRMRVEDDAAIAEVQDDGPGVPEDELERAFEPFYRASNATESGKNGSGLGLAVCRSIARAHGGDVVLVRTPEGFAAQLRLPLAYDAARLAA